MALHNYFSELMAINGIEHLEVIPDDARIAQQQPKRKMKKRRSRTRHPTFRSSPKGLSPPPNRPSRKCSDEDLQSMGSRIGSRCCKIEETKNSLELFYSEVAPNRTPKSPAKEESESQSEFESMDSIESVEE